MYFFMKWKEREIKIFIFLYWAYHDSTFFFAGIHSLIHITVAVTSVTFGKVTTLIFAKFGEWSGLYQHVVHACKILFGYCTKIRVCVTINYNCFEEQTRPKGFLVFLWSRSVGLVFIDIKKTKNKNFMATLTLWLFLWAVEHVRSIFVVDYGFPYDIHIVFNENVSQRQLNAL